RPGRLAPLGGGAARRAVPGGGSRPVLGSAASAARATSPVRRSAFCNSRGTVYVPLMPICTKCGRQNDGRVASCVGCGAELAGVPVRREQRKTVPVLFCVLVESSQLAQRVPQ